MKLSQDSPTVCAATPGPQCVPSACPLSVSHSARLPLSVSPSAPRGGLVLCRGTAPGRDPRAHLTAQVPEEGRLPRPGRAMCAKRGHTARPQGRQSRGKGRCQATEPAPPLQPRTDGAVLSSSGKGLFYQNLKLRISN